MRLHLLLGSAVAAALVTGAAASTGGPVGPSVTAIGVDRALTNYVPVAFSAAQAGQLSLRWSAKLDGAIHSAPLYVTAEHVGTYVGGVVYVATEAGSIYALRARNGSTLWRRTVARPLTACGTSFGITSSPVIDEQAHRLYTIGANGLLDALDTRTGRVVPGWPVRVVKQPQLEYVWGGLQLYAGSVYVGVASYCDHAGADGYVVAVDAARAAVTHVFDVVPGPGNLGGVWGWGGLSIDPAANRLYVATGNSIVHRNGNLIEDAGYAERVVALTPALRPLASWRRADSPGEIAGDADFGAAPLLFQPPGCPPLVSANSKNAYTYVWDRTKPDTPPLFKDELGSTKSDDPFIGRPTYIPSLREIVVAQAAFIQNGQSVRGLEAFTIDASCRFHSAWTVNVGGGPGPPALAVGGVVFWASPSAGLLVGVDAATGQVAFSYHEGPAYGPLLWAGDLLVGGAEDGTLRAFG